MHGGNNRQIRYFISNCWCSHCLDWSKNNDNDHKLRFVISNFWCSQIIKWSWINQHPYKRWSLRLAWPDFTLQSPNPATFSPTNPIERKKLVSPWVLLYWVSKRERSSAIKTTLLSLLLITSTQPQHIGILSPALLTHVLLWLRHCASNLYLLIALRRFKEDYLIHFD